MHIKIETTRVLSGFGVYFHEENQNKKILEFYKVSV
jgi:hypothetical protein